MWFIERQKIIDSDSKFPVHRAICRRINEPELSTRSQNSRFAERILNEGTEQLVNANTKFFLYQAISERIRKKNYRLKVEVLNLPRKKTEETIDKMWKLSVICRSMLVEGLVIVRSRGGKSREGGGMKMKKREIGRPGAKALALHLVPSRELDKHLTELARVFFKTRAPLLPCHLFGPWAIVLQRVHYQSFRSIKLVSAMLDSTFKNVYLKIRRQKKPTVKILLLAYYRKIYQ